MTTFSPNNQQHSFVFAHILKTFTIKILWQFQKFWEFPLNSTYGLIILSELYCKLTIQYTNISLYAVLPHLWPAGFRARAKMNQTPLLAPQPPYYPQGPPPSLITSPSQTIQETLKLPHFCNSILRVKNIAATPPLTKISSRILLFWLGWTDYTPIGQCTLPSPQA